MTTLDKLRQASLAAPTKHGPLAKPDFDLHRVSFFEGDHTIRNLKLVAIHCGWLEYHAQNGEIFRIEDGLL